jgi:hypothetical protein
VSESNPTERKKRVRPGAILRAAETKLAPFVPVFPDEVEQDGVKLTVVREGERIRRIVATCSCKRRIEIDCDYGEGNPFDPGSGSES